MAQVTRDIIQLKKSETGEVFYPETHADAVIGLGTAAKTDSGAYATATQGSHADDAYNLVKGNKDANKVLAGPASGSAGAASFRALVAADIPSITKSKISDFPTTWALANITGADDLKAIEALSGTSGVLKKTAENTWALDTNLATYASNGNTAYGYFTNGVLKSANLPLATSDGRGGIKIGYSESGTNYAVKLSNEKAYVTVPWTDTTYKLTLNGTAKGSGSTDLGSFYAPTSSGTSGHVLISGGANTAPSFRALVANDIPSLAISKITNLQSSLNAKLTKSGDTMTGQLNLGTNIPVRTTDVGIAPMYGNALNMRGTTGYIEGLKVNSAEGDYFYCADRRSEYTVTSNYKSGSPTVGEYGGSDCAYLFDLVSANRFMLYCPNLETTPWVLTIVKNSGVITATDVLDLWFFQTSNVGYLNSYKIEVLTQITGTSTYEWFTVVDRDNVNDRMHQAAFPIWLVDDTHGTANHSYGNCAGVRITIRKADPTGTWSENYLPICAIQLRDRRPSHKPSAGIGAMDMRGGTFYGDVTFDYGSLTTHDVKPGANNTYSLGTTASRWQNILGVNANFSGTGTISGNTTIGGTLTVGNTLTVNIASQKTAYFNNTTANATQSYAYFRINGTNKASIGFFEGLAYIANETTYARIGVNNSGEPQYWSSASASTAKTIWHAGNSNLSTVDWIAKNLSASGTLAVAGLATISGGISLGTQYTPSGSSMAVDSKLV